MDDHGLMMKYFVLKPSAKGWHGEASRAALEAYENVARSNNMVQNCFFVYVFVLLAGLYRVPARNHFWRW